MEALQVEVAAYVPELTIIAGRVALAVLWIKTDDPVRGNDVEFLVRAFKLTVIYQKRAAFTRNTINQMWSKYPKFNWVICLSPYYFAEFVGHGLGSP